MTSLSSYTLVHTDTNVKLCVYTAREILGAEVQVLHTSCASIHQDARGRNVDRDPRDSSPHETPQAIYIDGFSAQLIEFMRSLYIHTDSVGCPYVTGRYPRAAGSPQAIVSRGSCLSCF